MVTRYLVPQIEADLFRKMVFVAGPRQVGKTTMARGIPGADAGYLNWDVAEHRTPILLVECKLGDAPLDRSLRYLSARFPDTETWQISLTGTKDYLTPEGIRVAPAIELLRRLV